MTQNPLVSVIVPIYNVEQYVEKCLASIQQQKYANIEVILVDDGTPDSSGEIAKSFASTDERFHYYRKENGGLSSARNYGLEHCTGAYVSFVDSDDWVEPDFILQFIQAITEDDSDMVICNMRYVFADGNVRKRTPIIPNRQCVNSDKAIEDLLEQTIFRCHAQNKFFKRELFEDKESPVRFAEGRIYEDVFTTYKLFFNANKVSYIPSFTYNYLQNRKDSILNSGFSFKQFDLLDAFDEIYAVACNHPALKSAFEVMVSTGVVSLMNMIYPVYSSLEPDDARTVKSTILDTPRRYGNIRYVQLIRRTKIYGLRYFLIIHCFELYIMFMKVARK